MSGALKWGEWRIGKHQLPADGVRSGDNVLIVADEADQEEILDLLFPRLDGRVEAMSPFTLEDEKGIHAPGTPDYSMKVGSMISQRGMMANLSLRENLLLPFLYSGERQLLQQAEQRIDEVASVLGIGDLDCQAGARSGYMHALMSLGRCMLQDPEVIVVQEVLVGMSAEQLRQFIRKALKALSVIDAGILYLSGSEREGSGIRFARTHLLVESSVPVEMIA